MSSRPQRAHSSSAAAKSCSSEEKGRRPASARAQRELPQHLSSSAADRKSTRLNSSHDQISYAVFCLKKKHEVPRLHSLAVRWILGDQSVLASVIWTPS